MNQRNEKRPNARRQLEQVQQELKDAQELLAAIRNGEIDALVVDTAQGKRVYTLQGADESYRLMIERMHEGAATLTEQGIILYANRHLAKLFGRPLEKVIGTNFRCYLDPEHTSRFKTLLVAALHKDQRAEFDLSQGKDRSVPVQLSLSTLTVDDTTELCVVVSDLTKTNLNHTLEQRVAERTALAEQRAGQLRQAAADLVRAEQSERKRISQTLHDHLQQMLVTAKFQIGMIPDTMDQPVVRQRLLAEIDQLLVDAIEVSRDVSVDLSPPVLNERGLSDALHWLADRIRKQHKLSVAIRIQQEPEAEGPLIEPLRHFIFYSARELLLNAVKHAHCSKATVTLDLGEGNITLTVADNGRGCDPRRLQFTADPSVHLGIGLANIRQRTELWGGRLSFKLAPGKGCHVELQLPTLFSVKPVRAATSRASSSKKSSTPSSSKPSPKGARVLLADDHAVLRDSLAILLTRQGFTVVGQADDGQQAIDLAIDLQPDIVLMDVRMPNVDGIEATRIIREKAPQVRIIGLSMHNDTNTAQAMLNAGAVGYITKSSPADQLIQTIHDSLKRPRKSAHSKKRKIRSSDKE